MPTKTWAVGEEVLAADFNSYVQRQVVATFPNAAGRNAAITAPAAGMVCYLIDVAALQVHNGTAWVTVPGGTSAGYVALTANSGAVANTALVIPGLSVGVTVVGTRRIKLLASINVAQSGGPSLIRLSIREGATQVAGAFQSVISGGFMVITFGATVTAPAGAHSYDVLMSTDVGSAVVSGSPTQPSWHLAEDIG